MSSKENLFNESVKTKNAVKGEDKGFINSLSGTTIASKNTGTTVMNSGIYAQYKCDKDSGVCNEISLQSIANTVQRELTTCDLIINRHKFNTQFLEFTNMKENMYTVMGNLGIHTSILVKAWEPTLEEFVLIRRPARFNLFGNLLDAYVVDERLELDSNFNEDLLEYKRSLNDLTPPENETIPDEKDSNNESKEEGE
jgi:hypothetical protein